MDCKDVIQKWYDKIGFSERYDKEFYSALKSYEIDADITPETYDTNEQDGKKNFLYYLYFCEGLQIKYREKGITDDILYDTLSDLRLWLNTWSEIKGELYLGEIKWLSRHFAMKLFRIGRLQYCMAKAEHDISQRGLSRGDNIVEIHIPADGPLRREECEKSLDRAREFFGKLYPEFKYKYFSCNSWLLDEGLVKLLGNDSNIIRFQKLFDIQDRFKTDAILMFTLGHNINRENVKEAEAKTKFAQTIKDLAVAGETFYAGFGLIEN